MDEIEKLKQEFNEFHQIRMQYAHLIAKRNCGIGWPFGWNGIVRQIFELCEANKYQIAVAQVKEKFGGLRFYYDVIGQRNEELDRKIASIENQSDKTCDICGAGGIKGGKGWIVTRCEDHIEDRRPDFYSAGLGEMYNTTDQEFSLRLQQVGVAHVERE
jgi:hypothetical protein